jgi:hypothetical protein
MLAPRIEKATTLTNLMRLQRSLLRSSHALVRRALPIRTHRGVRTRLRVLGGHPLSSSSCCCIAFGPGKAHEHEIAICSSHASSMPGGDCLGSRSGVWRCKFSCAPHLDRLKASCDVSSPAAGPGGLNGLEASKTCCRATCTSGTCMAEAGECSAVSHPHPELLAMHDRRPSADPRRLPALQVFAHRSTSKDRTSRAELFRR